jgi:hypothetical protein
VTELLREGIAQAEREEFEEVKGPTLVAKTRLEWATRPGEQVGQPPLCENARSLHFASLRSG